MNGNKILEKCIEELKGDKPEIKYVLGMLEALLEMQPGEKKVCPVTTPSGGAGSAGPSSSNIPGSNTKAPTGNANAEMDEGKILEANMLANLGKVDKTAIVTEN